MSVARAFSTGTRTVAQMSVQKSSSAYRLEGFSKFKEDRSMDQSSFTASNPGLYMGNTTWNRLSTSGKSKIYLTPLS